MSTPMMGITYSLGLNQGTAIGVPVPLESPEDLRDMARQHLHELSLREWVEVMDGDRTSYLAVSKIVFVRYEILREEVLA